MDTPHKPQRDLSLRSPRTRAVLGQVPPIIVRMGTLCALVAIALLLGFSARYPYQHSYPAECFVLSVDSSANDSLVLSVKVRFTDARPKSYSWDCAALALSAPYCCKGALLRLSPMRDSLAFQRATVRIPYIVPSALNGNLIDASLGIREGTLLQRVVPFLR